MRFLDSLRDLLGPTQRVIWYDPAYRLPIPGIQAGVGIEPRRADLVAWALHNSKARKYFQLVRPERIALRDILRVHGRDYLTTLTQPDTLSRVFGLSGDEFPVDEVLNTVRLGAGGTAEATRSVLFNGGHHYNLLGGFHHAHPNKGWGLCPINDIAIAIAIARDKGFTGQIAIIDVDAHPPDGLAECLAHDDKTWIGSISGSHWGELPDLDETLLPSGTGDRTYLKELGRLLKRMPEPDLAYVIAGGDVLAEDKLGALNLSLSGTMERDRRIFEALRDVPTVWLPGGGYQSKSWRVIAGSLRAMLGNRAHLLPVDVDPMSDHFIAIAGGFQSGDLGGEDVWSDLGFGGMGGPARLLNFYTAEGIELAFQSYGLLDQLRRLGYSQFRVKIERGDTGDRLRLFAMAQEAEHLVLETVLRKRMIQGKKVLFINWLTLRHPVGTFTRERPKLPNQEVPGLGMTKEAILLFEQISERLDLDGISMRPATMHVAKSAYPRYQFVDPAREGRFRAMIRDLSKLPLAVASHAVRDGRVLLNGEPYQWEADDMVSWRDPQPVDRDARRVAFETSVFTVSKQADTP